MREILLVKTDGSAGLSVWQMAFKDLLPDIDVYDWADKSVDRDRVVYALVWQPEPGQLCRYPRLRLILSDAAGVGHILADPQLPVNIPIARMVTHETAERMADFVSMAALGLVRQLPELIEAQGSRQWASELTGKVSSRVSAGVMGLGHLGAHVALRLGAIGFRASGWARSHKTLAGVTTYAGKEELPSFLAKTDILINLLPETRETAGIIGVQALSQLPPGACVINVGRGTHLDLDALVEKIDSGHLSGAVLDVLENEPLASDHMLWRHPRVLVTPHVASFLPVRARAGQAARTIQAFRRGDVLPYAFDRAAGY
ncbi:Glyoxylate/hydroxypyruvate reductase A [Paraburkholderia phenoliruptrix]|uniref:Glyoxylate/hydroxypyruvate reductase A n=1 Tax=Paraburkholderia phenoliruptrix TaxID=252970 RepID=A0A6J5CFK3_9BURK|nr:glyoxylate/hydroxypyruvate reductase A [Paraburkholderia phenoliruptrix]CAB3733698.1 Glyoxylate/hydroxypyruvate reductase A [Paraburkholderia phenoliruptrix]